MNILSIFKTVQPVYQTPSHDRRQRQEQHDQERRHGDRRDNSEFGVICRKRTEEDLKLVYQKVHNHEKL